MNSITLMNMSDMQTIAYAIGAGLLLVAVVSIYNSLKTVKSGRTYGASLDTNY